MHQLLNEVENSTQNPPFPLLSEHRTEVRHLNIGENAVQVRSHIALLEQGSPQLAALSPLGHNLAWAVLVICVLLRIQIIQT